MPGRRILKGALCLLPLSLAFTFQPDPDILRKVYADALQRRESEYGAKDPRTAAAARDLGFFLRDRGDRKGAHPAFAKALEIDEANFGAGSRQALAGLIVLASVSPPVDAEALLRRAIAAPSIDSQLAVLALSSLGDLRLAASDRAGAAAYWRRALPHAEAAFGADSAEVRNILNSLSPVVTATEAIGLMNRAVASSRRSFGDNHPETATCQLNLAQALLRAGHNAEAAVQARESIAIFETTLGAQHPRVAAAAGVLAEALRKQGQVKEAETYYRRAIEIDQGAFGTGDERTRREAAALTSLMQAGARPPASK